MITHTFSIGELIWWTGALIAVCALLVALLDTQIDRETTRAHPQWFDGAGMYADALVVADGHVREAWMRLGKAVFMLWAGVAAGTLPNGPQNLASAQIVAAFFGIEALLLLSAAFARRDRNRLLYKRERGES